MEVNLPSPGKKLSDAEAMKLAIQVAYQGAAHVSPNPLVGAVVLDADGGFLAAGWHEFYGGPHAEVNAVKNLSKVQLQGAQVFVTLEPCAHEGKTPSCAKMLAKLPLKRVVFGLIDPNPLVAGQGAEILRTAGIATELFENNPEDQDLTAQLEEVCEAFLWNFRHKKIFVALKMASSLDGQVALRSGESQWITGPESREFVHYLRATHDAVLVGKGTIEFDNPALNVRHPEINKENKVVLIDGEGDLLTRFQTLNIAQVHKAENIFWCVSEYVKDNLQAVISKLPRPPQMIFVKTQVDGNLDLEDMLAQLYQRGLRSVLVEGGAYTASAFVEQRLVNRLYLFQAPIILGSGGAKSWTESLRVAKMSEKLIVERPRHRTFGKDFMLTGSLTKN